MDDSLYRCTIAHIDSKYFAKDEVLKKLLQCAQFGECAFCGDIVRAFLNLSVK